MQVKLRVSTGSHAGREITVATEKFLIGRSDQCQLRPKSESVSRRHCVLVIRENRVLVQDLNSRNGTYVNDQRLATDRAKVLKAGDHLRVGKLEFEVVIDVAIGGAKKPGVRDMAEAASRTVEASSSDSRFEDVDISDWLDEADQVDRVRKMAAPETRQLKLDDTRKVEEVSEAESVELSDSGSSEMTPLKKRPEKKPPGKLPKIPSSTAPASSSGQAAGDALKKFFGGR